MEKWLCFVNGDELKNLIPPSHLNKLPPEKMNSLLAIHSFFASSLSSHASYVSAVFTVMISVPYRRKKRMVAIEIYVHKHSFLSLQLLTENWYFSIFPCTV
jgi:hypothetical protein